MIFVAVPDRGHAIELEERAVPDEDAFAANARIAPERVPPPEPRGQESRFGLVEESFVTRVVAEIGVA